MNYLAHHELARRVRPDAPPEFYFGNLLPDLIGKSGDGRLHPKHVADLGTDDVIAEGVRLHYAADRPFHAHPAFHEAMETAKARLKVIPFAEPPRRLFFVAHIFIEMALDACLLREDPTLAEDLYTRWDSANIPSIVAWTAERLGKPQDNLPILSRFLLQFRDERFLLDYTDDRKLAGRLTGVCRSVNLNNFALPEDRARLADAFAGFHQAILPLRNILPNLLENTKHHDKMQENLNPV